QPRQLPPAPLDSRAGPCSAPARWRQSSYIRRSAPPCHRQRDRHVATDSHTCAPHPRRFLPCSTHHHAGGSMLLHAHNVTKTYGAATVLHEVTLAVNPGERIGLVGANGAGKTTLLRILAGVESADTGAVSLAASVEIGYLPQSLPDRVGQTLGD